MTRTHARAARPRAGAWVGWGCFLGFGGTLFACEGLILATEAVGRDDAVRTDPASLVRAVAEQAPVPGVFMVVGLLAVVASAVVFFGVRPTFGVTLDVGLGVVGLLVTALASSAVVLADFTVHGLGTLLSGGVAAAAGSWSLARTIKPQPASQAPAATPVLPIQAPLPRGSATTATLPIVLTVALGATCWLLYRGRKQD